MPRFFLNTNNAPGITGDGHALAFAAGAALQDMEFVQFYPTALGRHGSRILLYEHLLVQPGVFLRNDKGEDILEKAGGISARQITRDQLAQLIMMQILSDPENGGGIFMDLSGLDLSTARELSALLPAAWEKGDRVFKVTPTAHFCMGGIVVDENSQTGCPGLFAAGEVTAGAHGANRLGGNALAEVFAAGAHTGQAAAGFAGGQSQNSVPGSQIRQTEDAIKQMMNEKGMPVKDAVSKLKQNHVAECRYYQRERQSSKGTGHH